MSGEILRAALNAGAKSTGDTTADVIEAALEVAEPLIRADERERLANDAFERGDIGNKANGVEAWVWLLGESAATSNPKRRLRIKDPA